MPATRRPPGPRQRFFFGSFREFRRNSLDFMTRCAREHGDIVGFRLARRQCILINHPDLIEQVLVKNNKNFIKHFAVRLAGGVLGNGLLSSEGDFWRRQRRMAAPAFNAEHIATYAADMVTSTAAMLATWRDGDRRDVHADMMQLTLDIVAKTLFGADVSGEAQEVDVALRAALDSFSSKLNTTIPLPAWIPTRRNRRYHAALGGLNRIVQQIIEQRRSENTPRNDLLSLLLHARDEDDGSQMTDVQLADEARTFLLAGHETTAITLSWTWYLLAQHPEVQTRLLAELQAVLGDRLPTAADVPKLTYAEHVIQEAMRLYPPAFVIGREALADFDLGGYRIEAGTTIFMSQWVMHRDPRFFERPDQFEPERWQTERAAGLPRMAYFPFGGGPRICIGNTFAMLESVLVLATVARQWSVAPGDDQPAQLSPLFTLRPRNGIQVIVSKHQRGRDGASPDLQVQGSNAGT